MNDYCQVILLPDTMVAFSEVVSELALGRATEDDGLQFVQHVLA